MSRRTRPLIALLALLALSAYTAESVVGSGCDAGGAVGAEMIDDAAAETRASHDHGHGGGEPTPDPGDPESGPCPLGMGGGGSSCVAASLPGAAGGGKPEPLNTALVASMGEDHPDLLLISSHFRPPRA